MKVISSSFNVSVLIDGKDGATGPQGPATPFYSISFTSYKAVYDVQTKRLSASFSLRVYKHEGASAPTAVTSYTPSYRIDSGTWTAITNYTPDGFYASISETLTSQPNGINFKVVINSGTYTAAMPISIKGELGKMCYISGEYSNDIEYTSNDSQTVGVTVKSQSGNTEEVYVLVASTNVNSSGQHIAPTDANQSVWEKGQNNYNLIRTTYLFSEFAKLGSGVVSGDWLFSANGTIGGVEFTDGQTYGSTGKPAYMFFDAGSLTGSKTIVPSERQVTGYVDTIGLSAGCKIIRITGRGTSSMTIALKDENGKEIGSQSFTSYQTKDITISNPIDAGTYTLYVISGSGYVNKVEIVSFAPKLAIDLKTGKTYMKNAYVEGEIVIRNSSNSGVVRINNGTASKETTETGVTILDAAGLYSRTGNDGFRIDGANGLRRYDDRTGSFIPMFAQRRVDVITVNAGNVTKVIDKTYDFILARNIVNFTLQLPSISVAGEGKVFTIQSTSQDRSVIVKASGSDKFIAGSSQTTTSVSVSNYERLELIGYSGIWYAIKQVWESS